MRIEEPLLDATNTEFSSTLFWKTPREGSFVLLRETRSIRWMLGSPPPELRVTARIAFEEEARDCT
jgi:hypothetical protein